MTRTHYIMIIITLLEGFMFICSLLTIVGLVFLLMYLPEKIRGASVRGLMLKSAVSCMFIFVGIAATACSGAEFGYFVIGGLVCGLLGDLWLDLKFIYPASDEEYTRPGFLAFAAGHLFYIIGMLRCFKGLPPVWFISAVIAAFLIGFAAVFMAPLLEQDYGKYKGISLFYAPFLFGTTTISAALSIRTGFSHISLTLMLIGGVLFALSDLVLGGTYFGKGHDRPIDYILNYAFYYGAQFLIAWSVLFA